MPIPVPVDLPDGAKFLSLTHRGVQGSRDYRLYIPAGQPPEPMPLIVMLHGCTQSPEDFATGTGMNALAEEYGFLVAWPAQPQGANAQKCWNWFRPEDQARDRGEPALLAGIVRDILRDHPADTARLYAAGLSAGGAAAAIMGAAYPDMFAAIGVHSGLPSGGAQDVPSAFAAMRSGAAGKAQAASVPTIVFHGLADRTVHPQNGAAVVAQALRARADLRRVYASGTSDGGRPYRQTRHEDAAGRSIAEHWEIDGAGHAWAGGHAHGSYTDPAGPDASREMLRFFLQHSRP
jgi:poly(hydroxyalkanoate) depolymerase family esterase